MPLVIIDSITLSSHMIHCTYMHAGNGFLICVCVCVCVCMCVRACVRAVCVLIA